MFRGKRRKLSNVLRKKMREYEKERIPSYIVRYATRCFKDGTSLDSRNLENVPIETFLVELDESERAFNDIIEKIEELRVNRDWAFVVADYGCGKTQLKQRIIQGIQNSNRSPYIVCLSVDFYSDSFSAFCQRLIEQTK